MSNYNVKVKKDCVIIGYLLTLCEFHAYIWLRFLILRVNKQRSLRTGQLALNQCVLNIVKGSI